MEYYSVTKMYQIVPFAATWMDLDIIILSEGSQTKTNIMMPLIYGARKSDTNKLIYQTERDLQT